MAEQLSDLTPEQKREQRINWWRSSTDSINFVSNEARRAYQTRMERLINVYNIREPDRVPVALNFGSVPFLSQGRRLRDGIYDYQKLAQVYDQFNLKYAEALDAFATPFMVPPGNVFEILDFKLYVWPGHGLPTEGGNYQFVEGEYMRAEEYPALIHNPSDFWTRTFLPRIFGAFESFRTLDPATDLFEMPIGQLTALASPQVLDSLQKMIDAGRSLQQRQALMQRFARQGLEQGFPAAVSYLGKAPFDIIGDTLRGTRGIMNDMYRRPQILLEALEVVADFLIDSIVAHARASRGLIATFPLHKGADGWMSVKQFETFYWPTLRRVIQALNNEGIMLLLFAEGSYDTRLEYFTEFPRGFVHWWFDRTDMLKAKKIVGGKCSIQGNVPSSLLVTGSPAEVKAYSRRLIES